MTASLIAQKNNLMILLMGLQFGVSGENKSCITYLEDCENCELIFDDDLSTLKTLDSGDGVHQKIHRIEVNQTCVNTSEVEFRAVLDFDIQCSELSFLFTNHTNEACTSKKRCQATELAKYSEITSCSMKCPKRTNTDEMFEVTLMYEFFPTPWYLRDLRIYNGCPLIPEYLIPKRPEVYLDFDTIIPDQWHNNPEVDYYDGSFCKGMKTDRSLRQWAEVGVTEACLVRPETCTEGATLSAWINIDECNGTSGILSTFTQPYTTGFNIRCARETHHSCVLMLTNHTNKVTIIPINYDWHHLAFVYGNNSLLIYHNGTLVGSDLIGELRDERNSGDGKMVIGRQFVNKDEKYVSMHLDEVMIWDQALDSDEINYLYNKYNGFSNEEIGK